MLSCLIGNSAERWEQGGNTNNHNNNIDYQNIFFFFFFNHIAYLNCDVVLCQMWFDVSWFAAPRWKHIHIHTHIRTPIRTYTQMESVMGANIKELSYFTASHTPWPHEAQRASHTTRLHIIPWSHHIDFMTMRAWTGNTIKWKNRKQTVKDTMTIIIYEVAKIVWMKTSEHENTQCNTTHASIPAERRRWRSSVMWQCTGKEQINTTKSESDQWISCTLQSQS